MLIMWNVKLEMSFLKKSRILTDAVRHAGTPGIEKVDDTKCQSEETSLELRQQATWNAWLFNCVDGDPRPLNITHFSWLHGGSIWFFKQVKKTSNCPKNPDPSYGNTRPSYSHTPGASKQVG